MYLWLNNKQEELNLGLKLTVNDFDYVLFVTSKTMKCFGCGKEGHLIRACPEKLRAAMDEGKGEQQEVGEDRGGVGRTGLSRLM